VLGEPLTYSLNITNSVLNLAINFFWQLRLNHETTRRARNNTKKIRVFSCCFVVPGFVRLVPTVYQACCKTGAEAVVDVYYGDV
jgi:hypothetical protein